MIVEVGIDFETKGVYEKVMNFIFAYENLNRVQQIIGILLKRGLKIPQAMFHRADSQNYKSVYGMVITKGGSNIRAYCKMQSHANRLQIIICGSIKKKGQNIKDDKNVLSLVKKIEGYEFKKEPEKYKNEGFIDPKLIS